MAEVKWIKIYTNIINHKKIKRIRKMPEGNNIILIWVFLLALAGESNQNGGLFLTDTMPYKDEDLAIEFDFDIETIRFALITLERFRMIETFEAVLYIKNWAEYQNIDGMERVRELTKNRVNRYREGKKLLTNTECNVTCNATVTQCNATDIDIDIDKDKDKEIYIVDDYHACCPTLPKIKALTDKRKKAIKKISKEFTESDIHKVFTFAEQSDFLSGRNGKWSNCGFDWLVNYNNFIKVLEGNYNKENTQKSGIDILAEIARGDSDRNRDSQDIDVDCQNTSENS